MMSHEFSLWLEFEHWKPPGHDEHEPYFNMQITLGDGRIYALNVWLIDAVARIAEGSEESAIDLRGRYVLGPDLLVEKMERALLERVVADLIRRDELQDRWRF